MGSYVNWSSDAQIISDSPFVYKRELEGTLSQMLTKNFSLVEHRQQALEIWSHLNMQYIIDRETRFPLDKTYVNFESCDLAKIEAQMLAALSFKDASKFRNEPESMSALRVQQNGPAISFDNSNDASKAYYEALRTIKSSISMSTCVFTRYSFEDRFTLNWA